MGIKTKRATTPQARGAGSPPLCPCSLLVRLKKLKLKLAMRLWLRGGYSGCTMCMCLIHIRCAILLTIITLYARYQMINSKSPAMTAACLEEMLSLSIAIYLSFSLCVHNGSVTAAHPSGTTYSYITKGYRSILCAFLLSFFALSGQHFLPPAPLEGDTVAHTQWTRQLLNKKKMYIKILLAHKKNIRTSRICVCTQEPKKNKKSTHKKRNFICWSALKMQMSR